MNPKKMKRRGKKKKKKKKKKINKITTIPEQRQEVHIFYSEVPLERLYSPVLCLI